MRVPDFWRPRSLALFLGTYPILSQDHTTTKLSQIFMFTFFLWIKAMKQASALYDTLAAVFYFYMVAAWGKSLKFGTEDHGSRTLRRWLRIHHEHDPAARSRPHTDGLLHKLFYVAYSSWYAIGTLLSMQVPFIGFQPVRTSEHMGALGMP
jgi:dolichyl-diphosphooligosaccharide--protein glycosyltransferase